VREFACAVASSQRAEPIFATASQVKRWLLVEVRGSWGRDAISNTDLGRHVDDGWRARMRADGIRVVAIRRDLDRVAHDTLHLFYVESAPAGGTAWRRDVAGLHAVVHATERLPGIGDAAAGWTRHDDDVVLVCTNGKHDVCCATFGRPVVRALRTSRYADAVWECSHIGGDRFAGNVVILPDGVYFGRCSPESALAALDGYQDGQLDLDHYRGRSALGFTHQAAEYFTRRQLGLTRRDAVASVRSLGEPADGRFVVTLADSARVTVTVQRTTEPAASPLTCTGPTGVTFPRYELVEFDSDSATMPR
jgi:hypothetical protein